MSEHAEQCAVVWWARVMEGKYPDLALLHAIPNGAKLTYSTNPKSGKRYSREAEHLIDEGLKRGVPDLSLPVARGGYHGLYIEMKVKPNKLTPEQAGFIEYLRQNGYHVPVCYSADEAISALENYLTSEKTVVVRV